MPPTLIVFLRRNASPPWNHDIGHRLRSLTLIHDNKWNLSVKLIFKLFVLDFLPEKYFRISASVSEFSCLLFQILSIRNDFVSAIKFHTTYLVKIKTITILTSRKTDAISKMFIAGTHLIRTLNSRIFNASHGDTL